MKRKHIILITVLIAIVILVAMRLMHNKEVVENKVYRYDREKPIFVQADTIKRMHPEIETRFSGNFEPDKEAKISAENQGKVIALWVDEGSRVTKGQRLIQLDNSALKLQLRTVEVQIEGLEADIRRYTILANADAVQGVQLEKAELSLKSAEAQRASLIDLIDKTTLVAPFEGIVTAKFTEIGSFAAPGVPLLQLTDISRLRFRVNVAENDLGKFKEGQDYRISADVYPGIGLQGNVSLIGSKTNSANRYPIQLTVENTSDMQIKAGMSGKLHYQPEGQEERMVIPSSAIIGSMNNPKVYMIKNERAVLHDVSIESRFGSQVVITSGLSEGDVIVTGGFINLFDSARVTIKNQ